MFSTSTTGRAAEPNAPISWRFVVFWALSLAVPWLLLAIVRSAIFGFAPEDLAYPAAVLLPILCWLLIAFLQFRLLRSYLRRASLWLIATFVGGNLGSFAGGWVQLETMSRLEMYAYSKVLISDYNSVIHSDWILAAAPIASIVAGVFVAATLLGFLQSLCLDDPLGARLLWLFASAVSGIVAAAFGYGCYIAYLRIMLEIYPLAVVRADIIPALIAVAVGMIGGTSVYGLLTGAVLRQLLLGGAQRQKEALITRFE